MLKQHSFSNPFSGIKEKFQKSGRSNSAPGAYDIYIDRFWSVCLCVCVCPTNQTHFVLGRLRAHMFSSCFSDIKRFFVLFFVFFVRLCRLHDCFFFLQKTRTIEWEKTSLQSLTYLCVCLFLHSLFAFADCMLAVILLQKTNGRKHLCDAWQNILRTFSQKQCIHNSV